MNDHDYPKRILLCVTGLSTQVVTETLYALSREDEALPTEVHLLTTAKGAERARLTLLSEDPGWFGRLCRDYHLAPIRFDDDCIHVLEDETGRPLEDIRSPRDNEVSADFITGRVRGFTADPDASLHVSIAGGRKTMGYYAGYALSLYGRPRDRLSHVLVSAPYESNQQFYYPTPYERIIYTQGPDSTPIDTRKARVTLARIPFVRLREGLSQALLEGDAGFIETIRQAQKNVGPADLALDTAGHRLWCGGEWVELSPIDFAFYAWFARRVVRGEGGVVRSRIDQGQTEAFLDEYRQVLGEMSLEVARVEQALAQGMDVAYFDSRKSRLHKQLRKALGAAARPYLVRSTGRRPETCYGLELRTSQVRFIAPRRSAASLPG